MNPCVAWSILTARSVSFPRLPRGHGGLSREDVCAMLAGMERPAYLMGLAYECGDKKALSELRSMLWLEVIVRARVGGWRATRPRMLCRNLAELALYEAFDPYVCPTCNGKGTTTFDLSERPDLILSPYYGELNEHEGRIRCATCRGSGKVKLSGRKRADLAGIDKRQWQEYWSDKYEPVYGLAKSWLAQARGELREKLNENSEIEAA